VTCTCNNEQFIYQLDEYKSEDVYLIYDAEYEYLHVFKKGIVRENMIFDEDRDYDFEEEPNIECTYRYERNKDLFVSVTQNYHFLVLRLNFFYK
jgi:hypothetical protein